MSSANRVVRRFVADTLTKHWLMSVRRGWKYLIEKLHPTYNKNFDQQLHKFLDNLDEQVRFTHPGAYIDEFKSSKAYSAFNKALQRVKNQITSVVEKESKLWNDFRFCQDRLDKVQEEIKRRTGEKPDLTQEEWQNVVTDEQYNAAMSKKYPELEEYLQARDYVCNLHREFLDKKAWQKDLLKAFDDMMKHLYADAAKLEKLKPQRPYWVERPGERYTQYAIGNVKVIIDDVTVSPKESDLYAKYLIETKKRLEKRGFGKVWYGEVFIQCEECGGENPYGKEFGVGGSFRIGPNTITIYSRPPPVFILSMMSA